MTLRPLLRAALIGSLCFAPLTPALAQSSLQTSLEPVLAGSWRSDTNRARDKFRHPQQTLEFFGLQPNMTVIELVPGGGNPWYAEILAPLLREKGVYIAANISPDSSADAREKASYQRGIDAQKAKFAGQPAQFGKAQTVQFNLKSPVFGPAGSADMVLTFRNAHNWIEENEVGGMFKAMYAVLKPGGVLGVVDHRAAPGKSLKEVMESGYLPVEYVIAQAEAAGFKFDKQTEVNANAKDMKDHPKGVWTLPPVLANKDIDREKYLAIGESDRMTLRFVKPAK